jgi:membrane-bound lytic murein transglycosylase D
VFFETNRASTPPDLERALKVRWSDLIRWNDLDPRARLQSGLMLQVLVPVDFRAADHGVVLYERDQVEHVIRGSRAHLEAELARRGKRRRGYRVRSGDTLQKIGTRYGLTIGDLSRINQVARDHTPQAGDLLVVYVDPRQQKGTVRAPAPTGFEDHEARATAGRPPSTAESARVPGRDEPAQTPSSDPPAEQPSRPPSTPQTSRVPGR